MMSAASLFEKKEKMSAASLFEKKEKMILVQKV
jgi:hypothetical protein